jgi:hypothetical protein
LSVWISAIKTAGFNAGVYASPIDAASDLAQLTPLPDDIWLASQNRRATVWGNFAGGLADSQWKSHQRIHQYNGDAINGGSYYQTWGGTTEHVDVDIEDVPLLR